jgi:hypothetical protein
MRLSFPALAPGADSQLLPRAKVDFQRRCGEPEHPGINPRFLLTGYKNWRLNIGWISMAVVGATPVCP